MRNVSFIRPVSVAIATCLLAGSSLSQEMLRREVSGTGIKELTVTIDLSFGHVTLKRGTGSPLAVIRYTEPEDPERDLTLEYSSSKESGRLLIRSEEETSFWGRHDNDHQEWNIELTDRLPLTLRFKLGAGDGELDLTRLKIQDMKISTGASTVRLTCDEPNAIRARTIEIESGVSKLSAYNLLNMNFERMYFSGGVGTYELDFGGRLATDAEVTIEVGLGAVTVDLPKNLPARIKHDASWFSSFDLDQEFQKKRKGVYESSAYDTSTKRLVIAIESGLGSVKIRRR